MKQAVSWVNQQGLTSVEFVRPDRGESKHAPMSNKGLIMALKLLGTIFNAQLDLTSLSVWLQR